METISVDTFDIKIRFKELYDFLVKFPDDPEWLKNSFPKVYQTRKDLGCLHFDQLIKENKINFSNKPITEGKAKTSSGIFYYFYGQFDVSDGSGHGFGVRIYDDG